ncbi:unnamed protein product [Closterium sp. Naga37s-1]|nr:unnamed protein product [Closterium sp. Naga37s-1]
MFTGDPYAWPSRRSPVLATRGMVASSQPLASEAGLRILRAGGNAADAAVAMAAALAVCEPCSTGLGGDAFLLFYRASTRTVHSIQGNGRCPAALSLPHLATLGFSQACPLPPFHPLTVTVPGGAACWADTIQRFGSRHVSLREALEPAVQLAEGGWPVPPLTAGQWERGVEQLKQGGPHGGELLVDGERAPRAGEVFKNPGMGNTLRLLGGASAAMSISGPASLSISLPKFIPHNLERFFFPLPSTHNRASQGWLPHLSNGRCHSGSGAGPGRYLHLTAPFMSSPPFPPSPTPFPLFPHQSKAGMASTQAPWWKPWSQQCRLRAGWSLCPTSYLMLRCSPSLPAPPPTTDKGKDGFYTGPVAEAIVAAVQSQGGVLSLHDLASHVSSFAPPISTTFHGLTIWEVPPPTHGLAALIALNITEAYYSTHGLPEPAREARGAGPEAAGEAREEGRVKGEADFTHVMIEAMRMGFADALACVADPEHVQVPLGEALSKEYAAKRAGEIDLTRAAIVEPGIGAWEGVGTDTVYFCAVDGEGNACSMINSNYMGFGTGIVPKGCGFPIQNRGHNFSLDPDHPNCLAPGKRPYHTIIPGLATWGDTPSTAAAASAEAAAGAAAAAGEAGAEESRADAGVPAGDLHCTFGVMGGFMQPQGHLQVVTSLALLSLNPQAALDRPRFCLSGLPSLSPPGHGPGPVRESHVAIEEGLGREEVAEELRRRGHRVEVVRGEAREVFGKGQVIVRERGSGVLWGGSEGRADGCAMGF